MSVCHVPAICEKGLIELQLLDLFTALNILAYSSNVKNVWFPTGPYKTKKAFHSHSLCFICLSFLLHQVLVRCSKDISFCVGDTKLFVLHGEFHRNSQTFFGLVVSLFKI